MRTEVVMPQMGESVTEGTLTQWLKKLGERVERDEPLFEMTTDKVDAEVPSPIEGILIEIHVEPGQTVEVNHVVAILDSEAAVGDSTTPSTRSAPVEASAPTTSVAKAAPRVSVSIASESTVDALRRTRSTPLVRKIAAEHGIGDLSVVGGTGLSNRVTKKDILAFIAKGAHKAPKQAARSHSLPPVVVGPRDRVEVMSPQRQAIARHMIASRATSAHAQTVHEVDFSAVADAKKALQADFMERGVRLTYTAFIMKAAAEALTFFPIVNSSLDGNQIVYRGEINLGMAVDVGSSLIVPVLKNVDELSLLGVARSVTDLAERARGKKLLPEDVKGGTFTITNPGIFGSEYGVPILNQPQSAILATGAIKKRVVVDQKTSAIMVKPTCMWCMSFDHRVVDGATADRFVVKMREIIENWTV